MNYFTYRIHAYRYALRDLVRQIQQFALMISTLFYIFLPGLIGALFFGLGRIVESDSEQVSNKVIWGYLLIQTLLLNVLKPIVLDMPHRAFHLTLLSSRIKQFLCDVGLLLCSHVLLWMSFVLAMAIGIDKLPQAPHFVLFITTQVSCSIALLYRPQALIYTLIGALALHALALPSTVYLGIINLLLLTACAIKPFKFRFLPKQVTIWQFWLLYGLENIWSLIWRFSVSFLFIWGAVIIAQERPELLHWYTPMIVAIALLLWGTLCIKTSTYLREHRLFWLSIKQFEYAFITQHTVIFALFFITWCISILMLGADRYMLGVLFLAPMIQWCAVRKAKHLAVCWAALIMSVYLVKILL